MSAAAHKPASIAICTPRAMNASGTRLAQPAQKRSRRLPARSKRASSGRRRGSFIALPARLPILIGCQQSGRRDHRFQDGICPWFSGIFPSSYGPAAYSPLSFLVVLFLQLSNSAVPPKEKAEFFSWTTVTYRSIALLIAVVAILGFTVLYFLFPDQGHAIRDKAQSYMASLWNKVSGTGHPADNAGGQLQQARFTMFDGTVRVKKANSNTWVAADYSLPLDKGDVVQTMAEGIAKVAFADGSTYSIQPDSLITIEENSTNASQQVQVGVRLQTGTFQLNTGDVASVQQVRIDNSTTTIGKDSALQASNDRRKGAPAVLVTKGLGTFEMAGEKQTLAPFERVSFNPESGEIRKEKEIAPPVLLSPANMMPLFVAAPGKPVDFTWTPVEGVKGYHVRLSRNPYFSSLEK